MSKVLTSLALGAAMIAASGTAFAAGNLAADGDRIALSINSDELTFSENRFELETGQYYILTISHDGGEEMQWMSPELFRNIWINQVVINDLEVKLYGVYSFEWDDAGDIILSFVPIRPGEYPFYVPGYEDRGLSGVFVVN